MIKSIIVARAKNRVIGRNNRLPWHLPKDLQHFKRVTMGHHVIMGRKTFESIKKPLPGRKLIIVTRNSSYQAAECIVVKDMFTAFFVAEQAGETEVLVAGGGEIYQEALAFVDRVYLTEIQAQLEGDTFFPEINLYEWREVQRIHHPADDQHLHTYDFVELARKIPS